ncbi:YceH family protein [Shewanella chilikensis]|uniref:YceH family protein n=1 Tax=Shewanella chilikensis TaxID=558541 RepID=UPI003A9745FE
MLQLNAIEARVIGCLLEKEVTTPDLYPLSLNSLTQACNQKTSRDPVMELNESEVQQALDSLSKKRLLSEQSGFGSRVIKYRHRFCNTEFGELQFSPAELAIVCLLLLRGAQTAGELRSRAQRLFEFDGLPQVEQTLLALKDKGFIRQLAREPGKREIRFAENFTENDGVSESSGGADTSQIANQAAAHREGERERKCESEPETASQSRIALLELELTTIKQELALLKQELAELKAQLA